ncbi:BnaC05g50790D [Brassica napus]|uniref:BnaC05g50790D protein n=1 Tax=Brassica napus TaxID=3708 RepID=A0A078J411_BRANA|nr:BnaC05g50790D [Brassica napus]
MIILDYQTINSSFSARGEQLIQPEIHLVLLALVGQSVSLLIHLSYRYLRLRSTVMNCLSHHARSYISLGLLKISSYVTSKIPPWNQCFYMPSKPCLNPASVVSPLGLSRAHCYSSRSKSGKSKMLTAEKEKDAFFVVRKGDVIGIYKDLNDCQAQLGSSVFDPPVSVYKGYSLPKDSEDYLSSVGMKNPLYCFGASDLREDMFGSLTPCLFQEPTSSKVKVSEEEDTSELKSKDMKHDMPSASVFDQQLKPSAVTSDETCFIEFDGASKGNPGLSGAAAVLKTEDGSLICKVRQGLGIATNNAAEYHGLILGLKHAIERGYKKIKVKGDSKLICMQIKGKWKVNNEVLSKLHEEAKQLTNECISFEISHVLRNLNSAADEQANLAVRLPGNVERISRMLTKALRILKPRSIPGPVYSSSPSPRLTPGAVSRTTAGAAEIDADDAVAYSDPTESPTAMPITMQVHLQPRVVVYDGVCHLCHGGVKWIIKADKYRKIKFCCLQSKSAEPYLTVSGVTKEDVQKRFLFIEGLGSYHQASTAALRVVSYLPLPYSALKAFAIVPTPLRDSVYDYVANNRYNWFGKAEDCLVLKEKELLERFIDRDELIDRC